MMERSAIEPLLTMNHVRVFALDRYLEARSAFAETRGELDDFIAAFRRSATRSVRRSHEIMYRYALAERNFLSADVDLQRFHRRLDIGCKFVSVGHLARAHDIVEGRRFVFIDESPKTEESRRRQELRVGDWLRIWSPGREQRLLSGKIYEASGAATDLQFCDRSLSALASWFDRNFPAEFAAG